MFRSARPWSYVTLTAALSIVGTFGCADVAPPPETAADRSAPRENDTAVASPDQHVDGSFSKAVGPGRSNGAIAKHAMLRNANKSPANREEESVLADPVAHAYLADVLPLDRGAPATRYASLSEGECKKEIKKRGLPFIDNPKTLRSVAVPMRFSGALHGIRFVTPPASSAFGVLDCRLALALDDLSVELADLGVVSVRIDNFYRQDAHLPGKKKKSQHAFALAADIVSFTFADGRTLAPEDDWHAPIGSVSCGPEAELEDPSEASIALRDLYCDVARKGFFHHMLSPSFNAAHRTHFHFDIQEGLTRQSVR